MSDTNNPSKIFWIVAALILIWNGIGCTLYLVDTLMSDAGYTEMYGEAMTAVRNNYPAWSIAAYAIAAWGGLLAAIMLLLRKKLTVPLFMLSLAAAIISFIWGLTNDEAKAAADGSGAFMPVIVVAIGVFEIWWSRRLRARNILT